MTTPDLMFDLQSERDRRLSNQRHLPRCFTVCPSHTCGPTCVWCCGTGRVSKATARALTPGGKS